MQQTSEGRMARDPFTGAQIRMGVMGSAGGEFGRVLAESCHELGRAIAVRGCCLLTGACPGLPHEVVLAAKSAGGHVVGISPAFTLREHVETYGSPYCEYHQREPAELMMLSRHFPGVCLVAGRVS